MEAKACAGGPVAIVGGGNSAGQAALYLARTCTDVRIVIRGQSLASSMSRYLIDQIERDPRVHVVSQTEVTGLLGEQELQGVELRTIAGETSSLTVCGLFVFIGANPCTGWLGGQLAEDGHGFMLTGADVGANQYEWAGEMPLVLETSRPGIFCVGDVRSRSIKRVAAAAGEGSMAVRLVFERLEATGLGLAAPPPAN
jgi:thioredoxin reductase (NADPH)